MDQNHSAGSDPYETSSPSIPLFTKPVGHLSSSSIVSTIALSLVGAALLIYVVIYAGVLLFKHKPRKAFPSEHTYITNTTDGSVSEPQTLHYTSEYLTDEELQINKNLTRPTTSSPLSDKLKETPTAQTQVYKSNNIELSVIVPCYNETERLHLFLEDAIPVLNTLYPTTPDQSTSSSTGVSPNPSALPSPVTTSPRPVSKEPRWEILLVDDGSSDGTDKYAIEWAASQNKNGKYYLPPGTLRICKLEKNRGKGGAVAHGMLHVRGKCAIFADADGASKFDDIRRLLKSIEDEVKNRTGNASQDFEYPVVAIGSRAHMVKTDAVVKRSFIRNFLMYCLHALVYVFGIRTIGDTQCGFKMYTRSAILQIFPYMHTEGWIFDVETLLIAMRNNIPIKEVPISWHEVEGSKVELAKDSIKMAIDLVVTRLAYVLGVYTDGSKKSKRAQKLAATRSQPQVKLD